MLARNAASSLGACRRGISLHKPYCPPSSRGRSYVVLKPSRTRNDRRSAVSLATLSLRLTSSELSLNLRTWAGQKNPNLEHVMTRVRSYTSDATQSQYDPLKDDSHPSLYYHLFEDDELLNPVFALSFLEEKPKSARSKVVLGWLPALFSSDTESGENGLNDFRQNKDFLPILHKTIKEGLLQDEIWTNGAIQTQSGWMHIFDQRNIPPLGRIPDPDDILASVRVEDGRMLIDTYEPMPSYRLCTADGVCQLTDTLMARLKAMLKQIEEEERQNH
ncbi:hypothetical protein ACEPAI_2525 [Sanghuangporus weigelae]